MTQSDIERELSALEEIIERGNEDLTLLPRARALLEIVPFDQEELRLRALIIGSEALIVNEQARAAEPLLDEAQQYCSEEHRRKLYSKLTATRGKLLFDISEHNPALEHLERALALHEELEMIVEVAQVSDLIGSVHASTGRHREANEILHRALSIFEQLGMRAQVAKVITHIGNVSFTLSDNGKALEEYSHSLSILEELGAKHAAAIVLANIGLIHLRQLDYHKALEYNNRALALHEELGMSESIAGVSSALGNTYYNLSNYPKALEFYNRSLALYEEQGNKTGLSIVTGNIGNVYLNTSNYLKALEYYDRSLGLHEELGMKESVAIVTGNMANAYLNLSDYPRALEYYNRALAMDEELGLKAYASNVTGNIGQYYSSLKDFHKALEYFNKALESSRELGDRRMEAFWLRGLGEVYLETNKYELSRQALSESLHLRRDILQSEEDVCANYRLLAQLEYAEGNNSASLGFYRQTIEVATTLGVRDEECRAHEGLAKLYAHTNQFKEAYHHHLTCVKIKEELNLNEARKKADYLDQERKREHRERQLAAENAEREKLFAAERAAAAATTSLLHRVLPQSIASRMIDGDEEISDYFTNVSILFADIVGFTPLSTEMPAFMVVRFLNFVFKEFDRIVKKHGCEKVKTIGDGYMAVAGAPVECSDHAERICAAALEMQETIHLPDEIREYLPEGTRLGVRIGIHTGPVVAGVIGEERFVWDIYSDAVNIAARMESHGEQNKIHVTQDFVRHLQNRFSATKNNTHGLRFEKRGEIDVKGKGSMKTYFLEKE